MRMEKCVKCWTTAMRNKTRVQLQRRHHHMRRAAYRPSMASSQGLGASRLGPRWPCNIREPPLQRSCTKNRAERRKQKGKLGWQQAVVKELRLRRSNLVQSEREKVQITHMKCPGAILAWSTHARRRIAQRASGVVARDVAEAVERRQHQHCRTRTKRHRGNEDYQHDKMALPLAPAGMRLQPHQMQLLLRKRREACHHRGSCRWRHSSRHLPPSGRQSESHMRSQQHRRRNVELVDGLERTLQTPTT